MASKAKQSAHSEAQHCVPKLVGRQACGERENFVNALIKVRHPIKTNLHHLPPLIPLLQTDF